MMGFCHLGYRWILPHTTWSNSMVLLWFSSHSELWWFFFMIGFLLDFIFSTNGRSNRSPFRVRCWSIRPQSWTIPSSVCWATGRTRQNLLGWWWEMSLSFMLHSWSVRLQRKRDQEGPFTDECLSSVVFSFTVAVLTTSMPSLYLSISQPFYGFWLIITLWSSTFITRVTHNLLPALLAVDDGSRSWPAWNCL